MAEPAQSPIGKLVRFALLVAGSCSVGLGLFGFGIGRANDRFLTDLNRDIAPAYVGSEERVLRTFARVSEWQYFEASRISSPFHRWLAEFEHASPLHVSARAAMTAGADRIGPCGSLSRSMLVLLHGGGIPARKAILYNASKGIGMHTVVEVQLDGAWRVFDPTYRWYWRRPDGKIATAADLAADRALFSRILERHPDYPLDAYSYDDVHHLRWEKLPGLPRLRRFLIAHWGADRVRAVRTPYLYERPMYLIGCICLGAGLALLGSVAWSDRRAARRQGTGARTPAPPGSGTLPPRLL
jgi:hypothetical protein